MGSKEDSNYTNPASVLLVLKFVSTREIGRIKFASPSANYYAELKPLRVFKQRLSKVHMTHFKWSIYVILEREWDRERESHSDKLQTTSNDIAPAPC